MKKIVPYFLYFQLFICCRTHIDGAYEYGYVFTNTSHMRFTQLDSTLKRFIPIANDELKNSEFLIKTYDLINGNKSSKMEKLLKHLENTEEKNSDVYISMALIDFWLGKYSEALNNLEKVGSDRFQLLKILLKTDLNCELAKKNNSINFDKFLSLYQSLVDSYPEDEFLKKTVMIRLRYLRYKE